MHQGGVDDGWVEILAIVRCPWANVDKARTGSRVTGNEGVWYLTRVPSFPLRQLLRSNVLQASQRPESMSTPRVVFLKRSLNRCDEKEPIGRRTSREEG